LNSRGRGSHHSKLKKGKGWVGLRRGVRKWGGVSSSILLKKFDCRERKGSGVLVFTSGEFKKGESPSRDLKTLISIDGKDKSRGVVGGWQGQRASTTKGEQRGRRRRSRPGEKK